MKEQLYICDHKSGVCLKAEDRLFHSMLSANILSRVRQKCERIDELMIKQGAEPRTARAFASVMNPMLKMCRNAKAALKLESDVLDPVLQSLERGATVEEIKQAVDATLSLMEKKRAIRTQNR